MLIYRQDWEESERGWGTRPDGCSLHIYRSDIQSYVKKYWDELSDDVPDEYSRPSGDPCAIDRDSISDKLFDLLRKSNDGIRLWQWELGKLMNNKDITPAAEEELRLAAEAYAKYHSPENKEKYDYDKGFIGNDIGIIEDGEGQSY